jgi:hypothetical protein
MRGVPLFGAWRLFAAARISRAIIKIGNDPEQTGLEGGGGADPGGEDMWEGG